MQGHSRDLCGHVTALVTQYVPVGTSIEDAQSILRHAGFTLSPSALDPGESRSVSGRLYLDSNIAARILCITGSGASKAKYPVTVERVSAYIGAVCL